MSDTEEAAMEMNQSNAGEEREVTPATPVCRRSTRVRRQPTHLKDFHVFSQMVSREGTSTVNAVLVKK